MLAQDSLRPPTGPKVALIIAAAGTGSRMQSRQNKQFIEVCGRPVLEWSLRIFAGLSQINQGCVLLHPDYLDAGKRIVARAGLAFACDCVRGGPERQESVLLGLQSLDPDTEVVIIHDGARPLLAPVDLPTLLAPLQRYQGAVFAVAVKDTIKELGAGGAASRTLDRSRLRAVQTPQVFRYQPLLAAHKKAVAEGYLATDDAALIERYGGMVGFIPGSYQNLKITTAEDLVWARAILQSRK